MILQCEQCNTRFRLDDSKLKPGGVKVRCSKCRHVFLAGADQPQEEADFDAILSGLGAPAPETPTPPSEPKVSFGDELEQQQARVASATTASGFAVSAEQALGEELSLDQGKSAPIASDDADVGAFSFDFEPETTPKSDDTASLEGVSFETLGLSESGAGRDVAALADFNFELEPSEPVKPAATAPAEGALEFTEFDFDAEQVPTPPSTSTDGLDFGEFTFDDEPAATTVTQAAPSELKFGEFEFEAEPVPAKEQGGMGEVSFDAAPAAKSTAPAAVDDLDFGEISFDAPPAEKPGTTDADAGPDLDFGDIAFDAEPVAPVAGSAVKEEESLDFGEFSFEDEGSALEAEQPAAGKAAGADEFVFSSEPFEPEEASAAPQRGPAVQGAVTEPTAAQAAPLRQEPSAAPASFSFTDDLAEEHPAAASPGKKAEEEPHEDWMSPAHADGKQQGFAASFPGDHAAAFAGDHAAEDMEHEDDELPPLSISSRRKGKSLLTASVVAVSLLAIAGLSGAGFYLLKSGPAAFDKIGLGFVPSWFGIQNVEEGRIAINNPLAAFHQNKEAGELFVVTGQAENQFRKPRASIHVRVTLFDKSGKPIAQKSAYCGNMLTNEQLATLPMAKIEAAMSNQFGDSLSNLGVKPGQKIPFVVAIPNVPKEAADFGVDVAGSTVAAQ